MNGAITITRITPAFFIGVTGKLFLRPVRGKAYNKISF